jgi:3-oxoacyl-[acyl-carrier protein] reductase
MYLDNNMTKAIVLGGSRGIGKAISDSLKSIEIDVFAASKKDIDTSNLDSVKKFLEIHNETDILILNTGGPEPKLFLNITEEDWKKYHNQLFLGFCTILQKIKINENGYIFLISSNVIKEPNTKLIISSAYRAAFSEIFKILSKEYAQKNISCINIAPGPINTDRTKELIDNIEEFEKTLPMKRLGKPEEIGNFVKAIIENNIKYLSGVTINFDGANSNYIF